MKCVLVVNPVSGKGKAMAAADLLTAALETRGHVVGRMTTLPDSRAFAAQCADLDPEDRVICIGGDGTLLYFLNAATHDHRVAFYGMGTANVVSIEYALPRDPEAFADMVTAGKTADLYPGLLGDGTRFLMMASVGYDAYLVSQVSSRLKNRIGKWAFLVPALKALWAYRYPRVTLRLDGGPPRAVTFMAACRFKHYGGNHILAPNADAASLQFEVLTIESGGLVSVIRFLWGLVRNDVLRWDKVTAQTAREITVSGTAPAQVDGDYLPDGVHTIRVAPTAFRLLVP